MTTPRNPQEEFRNTNPMDGYVFLTCSLLALIILSVDFVTPLGVASGIPYIVVVLVSLKSSKKQFTLIAALICTLFVGVGCLFLPPSTAPIYQVIANRALSIFAIWVTAILALKQRVRIDEWHQERLKYLQSIQELEMQREKLKVLKATMRTVQDVTGNFLNNLQYFKVMIDKNKSLTLEEMNALDELIHDTSSRLNKMGNLNEVREKKMAGDMIGIDYEYSKTNEDTISKSSNL